MPLGKLCPSTKAIGVDKTYVEVARDLYNDCNIMVKVGTLIFQEFPVGQSLQLGYSLAPLLFKIHLERALRQWSRKCSSVGIPIEEETYLIIRR